MKTRQNVHTYRIDKKCDNCLTGSLITTGNGFEHQCDNIDCLRYGDQHTVQRAPQVFRLTILHSSAA